MHNLEIIFKLIFSQVQVTGYLGKMVEVSKKIAIIYATQTGQAKTIAETINDEAISNGFEPVLYDISQFGRQRPLNQITDPVVFVCSTTGDGEVPESATRCYNSLKKIEAESDGNFLKNFNYALLGLGDTNYTQFCNGPKLFHQKFQNLGAKCFYGPSWADDGTGLDVEVEPFIQGLWDALDAFFQNANQHSSNQKIQINTDQLISQLNKLSIINPNLSSELSVPEYVENHLKINFIDEEKKNFDINDLKNIFSHMYPQSSSGILTATVIDNCLISDKLAEKECYDLKFSLDEKLQYEPGHAVDCLCPNDENEVEQLLKRLNLEDKKDKIFCLESNNPSKKLGQTYVKLSQQNKLTLKAFFKYCVDLRWNSLKKNFFRFLSEYSSDVNEKNRLLQLSSREDNEEYHNLVREMHTSLLDVLNTFKSCQPPVDHLIQMLLALNPRSYSLCSNNDQLEFVFNLVKFKKESTRTYDRLGIATGYLHKLKKHDNFFLMNRKFQNFTFPSDEDKPLVMIGPGTGIAPFIGYLRSKKETLKNLNLYLFYGCRDPNKDFLFKDEILNQLAPNLKLFSVSFSRYVYDKTTCCDDYIEKYHVKESKYVQDSIRFYSKEMVRLIDEQNGYVYVCGDAKNMSKDVFNCFVECLTKELGLSSQDANAYLMNMIKTKRYKQDIWA